MAEGACEEFSLESTHNRYFISQYQQTHANCIQGLQARPKKWDK